MSDDEAKQLGFALVAVLVALMAVGVAVSVYFYRPSENGGIHSAIQAKKQAEELSQQAAARNELYQSAYNSVASTSF